MRKRILPFLLALLLCLQCVPAASAATVTASGTYSNLTWSLDSDGTLTLTGSGEVPSSSSAPWNTHKSSVKKLVLSSGITVLAYGAFSEYLALEEVILPDTLKTIRTNAFSRCSSLRTVHIPSSVTQIWDSAFQYCYALRSVTIPKSVTSLSSYVFSSCSALKNIYYTGTKTEWKETFTNADSVFPSGYTVHCSACSGGHTFGTYYPDQPDRYGPVRTAVCTKCDATNTISDTYDGYTFKVWSSGDRYYDAGASVNSWGDLVRTGSANGATFTLEKDSKSDQYYIYTKNARGTYYLRAVSGAPAVDSDPYDATYYLGTTTSKSSAALWSLKNSRFCTTVGGTELMLYKLLYSPPKDYYDFRLTDPMENAGSYPISVYHTVTASPHTHTPGTVTREEVIEATYLTDGSYDEVTRCTVCGQVLSRKEVTIPATGADVLDQIRISYDEPTGTVTLEGIPLGLIPVLAAYDGTRMASASMPTVENGTASVTFPGTLSFDSLQFFLLTEDTCIPVAAARSVPLTADPAA